MPTGGDRWFQVVADLVKQPDSAWWADSKLGVADRDEMIEYAANRAWAEARDRLGGRAWFSSFAGTEVEMGGGFVHRAQPHMDVAIETGFLAADEVEAILS